MYRGDELAPIATPPGNYGKTSNPDKTARCVSKQTNSGHREYDQSNTCCCCPVARPNCQLVLVLVLVLIFELFFICSTYLEWLGTY